MADAVEYPASFRRMLGQIRLQQAKCAEGMLQRRGLGEEGDGMLAHDEGSAARWLREGLCIVRGALDGERTTLSTIAYS